MKFSGELFTYSDQDTVLTAFETGPIHSPKTVVFIGGLGDGYNAVSFLEPLQTMLIGLGWSLVQVQLSSSYIGYGTSDLQTDCNQLDLLVEHLKSKREKSTIVFLGHSTGCQDCYWHNKYGKMNNHIAAYILQAPVSDREHFENNLENFQGYLDQATHLRKDGKGQSLMPREAMGVPITADRFYSLTAKGGDDDVFSTDLTEAEITKLYQGITRPVCWIYSEKDEFYGSTLDKTQVMEKYKRLCPVIEKTVLILEGDHNINSKDSQKQFVEFVREFLQTN